MKNPEYSLDELEKLLVQRNNDPVNGFDCADKPLSYFLTGMMEELGEIVGAIKKLERGFNPREKVKLITKLQKKFEDKYPGQEHNFQMATAQELESLWVKNRLQDFAKEGADLFLYWILVQNLVGKKYGVRLDFFTLVQDKFNEVSRELNPNTTYII